ncbi:type II secretion system protein GspF [Solemya pervernicosa gill symbiont]|uniref:General secretion pathway protein F n=2 Tax=Gammaproteobacteria incertae sedis TaxID=118884 RepID=A0A1T2L906_9GAMM|nr:type II secretion system inner membrane protein GspF [Candidatus Reidiella endopervernicosa]OOZ41589.1 type II secretion system protein GspF [Solemya pervernicosa gill symbiont]QKQ27993.1 type II secretion system inner membrane protein GspF [Candidatus Reidiella endopervernicosa]
MSAFEYAALDNTGKTRKGVLEGDTARQIRQQLRDLQLTPLQVEPVTEREQRSQKQQLFVRSIGATDLALITRQLATLIRAGLPLEEVLQSVAKQSDKPRIKSMLLEVRAQVMAGHPLAEGMGRFSHIFPDMYRATVAAGEQSGHLDTVLERLADYTENRQQMQQKIQLALFYPALLTVMSVLIAGGLLTYVVPEVVRVFDNIGQTLPWLTRALITLSEFLQSYGIYLVLALGLSAIALQRLLRHEGPRYQFHTLLLKLPLIARLNRGLNTALFARTFSILTASGVPALDGLNISSQVVGSLPMRHAIDEAATKVREGSNLHTALEQSGHFPPMTLHLIASGEASGKLEEMLERAATNQEREVETLIAGLLGIFEPLLILVMGGIVLIIVLAILLPIFDLNQLVQ